MKGMQTVLPGVGAFLFSILTFSMLVMGLLVESALVPFLFALMFGILTAFCVLKLIQALKSGGVDLSGMGEERARILRFASSRQGRLTAEEAALGCHLSVKQAKALLDDMVINGTVDTWVSDGGSLVYVFQGLLEAEEKASARDPMSFLES